MKKKMKMGQTPKWLAVGVAGLLIVGGIYAISNSSSNLAGNNKQLGAVAAGVSSDLSKPKAGGIAAGTSSVQPIINVTTWPNFEMKLGAAGGENNLIAKAEYSITAQGGKIFVPVNWPFLSIKNSLDQYAYPRLTENKSLDAVSIVSCTWGQTCYVIPAGKTIRFTVRQVYEPAQMFGGVYSGKLNWMYFNTVENNNDFYYRAFPAQTSKLNTITIVGEKSPYLYTTSLDVDQGGVIALKGIRLTGTKPMVETSGFPQSVSQIISQDDSQITFSAKITPGVYRVYMSHPTYGNSNNAWVTVKKVGPDLTITNFFATTTGPVYPGQYVAVRFTMTNVGTYIANPAHYFYSNQADGYSVMNPDNTCTANTSLLPGQSCLSSISFKFGTEGYKNMEVTLDPNNEVFESNENNNRANLMISVSSKG
jgi:hypothetical protein